MPAASESEQITLQKGDVVRTHHGVYDIIYDGRPTVWDGIHRGYPHHRFNFIPQDLGSITQVYRDGHWIPVKPRYAEYGFELFRDTGGEQLPVPEMAPRSFLHLLEGLEYRRPGPHAIDAIRDAWNNARVEDDVRQRMIDTITRSVVAQQGRATIVITDWGDTNVLENGKRVEWLVGVGPPWYNENFSVYKWGAEDTIMDAKLEAEISLEEMMEDPNWRDRATVTDPRHPVPE